MRNVAAITLIAALCGGCSAAILDENARRYATPHTYEWGQIEANPSAWNGELVAVYGRVLWARYIPNTGTHFQLLIDDPKYRSAHSILAYFNGANPTSLAEGHMADVLGYIHGEATGTNAFGGTVTALRLNAIAVSDLDGRTTCLVSAADKHAAWEAGTLFARGD